MRAPLDGKIKVTPHGAYGYVREGGVVHQGVDLAAAHGTIVKAPEDGLVLVAANRNDLKPFSRYGPAFVYMKGWESGLWHLLAHLKKGSIRTAGGGYPRETSATGQTLITMGVPYPVKEGQYLGVVSDQNHLHWEINQGSKVPQGTVNDPEHWWRRVNAFDIRGELTLDPLKVLATMYEGGPQSTGGGSGLLLLLALLLLGKGRR